MAATYQGPTYLSAPIDSEHGSTRQPGVCWAYQFEGFVLDLARGELMDAAGQEVPLRPKSLSLLRLLLENFGRLVSKETIMAALWPTVFVTENNVDQCVSEIRNALGQGAHRILRTRPRRGYIVTADVTEMRSPAHPVRGMSRGQPDGDALSCAADRGAPICYS
jgi:DNA-binding winged helix-turn-helix (wHTH) protein